MFFVVLYGSLADRTLPRTAPAFGTPTPTAYQCRAELFGPRYPLAKLGSAASDAQSDLASDSERQLCLAVSLAAHLSSRDSPVIRFGLAVSLKSNQSPSVNSAERQVGATGLTPYAGGYTLSNVSTP